jgi:hypothetical protein
VSPRIRPLVVGLLWTALCLAALAGFVQVEWPTPDECLSADGLVDTCYCEALAPPPIRQPVNAGSSLLFVLAGWLILWPGRAGRPARALVFQALFGMMAVYLGAGSAAYHATQSDLGGFIDSSGMYLLPSLVGFIQLGRIRQHTAARTTALWLATNAALFAIAWTWDAVATELFTLVLVGLVASFVPVLRREPLSWRLHGLLLGVAISFLGGTVVWVLSGTGGPLCFPGSALQGHAVWHLATALSVVFLYAYVRRAPELAAP